MHKSTVRAAPEWRHSGNAGAPAVPGLPHQQGPVLRPRQAAARLQVAMATFWRLVKSNPDLLTPAKLTSRVTVFTIAQLDAFVAAKTKNPA